MPRKVVGVNPILASWVGRVRYEPAWALQRLVAELRAEGKLGDTLLLLEHEPVYTLGRRGSEAEILMDPDERQRRGIETVRSDRGGLVTYHGPGQLIGYPIFNLGVAADVRDFVCRIEKTMIGVAARFDVAAERIDGLPGVWVGDAKLGAIGVHISRGITTHGFALNVATDLDAFNGIVPCGIVDKTVTSLDVETGREVLMDDVVSATVEAAAEAFARPVSLTEMDFEAIAGG